MKTFLIICRDKKNSLNIRLSNRSYHLDYLQNLKDKLILAGPLLESNGDGTAKVQSDDIIRSKTIGKVTIGNSNTGVKLVSCVLYCG